MIEINRNPTRPELQVFSGLLAAFLAFVAWMLVRRGVALEIATAIAIVGLTGGVVGIAFPRAMRHVYVGWMTVVFPIGWIVSHLVLLVVYIGVFTPIGWALRLWGYDPMERRFDRSAKTYWRPREQRRDLESYFRPY